MKTTITARAIAALVALAVTFGVLSPAPAGASTAQERANFTTHVYEDYLFRAPTIDEFTWWEAYLAGGGSRTAMVTDVLEGDEFAYLWVSGVQQYYLGAANWDDPAFATMVTSLETSANFVATEVSVLGSAAYYSLAGSTNSAFVTKLYHDVLQRTGSPGDVAYWAGELTSGARTRNQVSQSFIRTTEAAARRVAGGASASSCATNVLSDVGSVGAGAYCIVLDRMADAPGASFWTGQLSGTSQMPALWASLTGSGEYFALAQL
jgi:hypothetical protein